jgi:enoyl-CoA hydratase
MECILTGDPISADRAYGFGLVNVRCGEGEALQQAKDLAGRISANAPLAVRESRRIALEATDQADEVGWKMSDEGMGKMLQTADLGEGLMAFIEKRPPNWKGR